MLYDIAYYFYYLIKIYTPILSNNTVKNYIVVEFLQNLAQNTFHL